MPDSEHYEVLIVGGGKAGKTLAADLGRTNASVCLVERGMIGGTCINVGCIPSKAIVKCAEIAHQVAAAEPFGVEVDQYRVRMLGVRSYKRSVVSGMVELNWKTLHGVLGDRMVLGEAKFVAPRTIEVTPAAGGKARRMSGEKLFINLGSKPAMPRLVGLTEAAPLTSSSIMELDQTPEHLIILGGGTIAVEFGQAFRRLGSSVTLIQRGGRLLSSDEVETSTAVGSILADDGIRLLLNAHCRSVEGRSGESVKLNLDMQEGPQTVVGSHLLVATGRSPATAGTGLTEAGIVLDGHGFIAVNDRLETSSANTWALGDCAGSPQQTHVALDDYRIVKANVFAGGSRTTQDRLIPRTVFIDPEVGHVGIAEPHARQQGIPIRVAQVAMSSIPRARTNSKMRGFMKAVVHSETNRILGFTMLGAQAGEVTAVVQTAMLGNLPFTALRDGVIAHPTMAEGLNYLFASFTH